MCRVSLGRRLKRTALLPRRRKCAEATHAGSTGFDGSGGSGADPGTAAFHKVESVERVG